MDDDACLLRIYDKDNTSDFGEMSEGKDLAADFLLIDKNDEDDNYFILLIILHHHHLH